MSFKEKFLTFLREEEGLTAVEYAVAGALVAGTLVVAFDALGLEIQRVIEDITDLLADSPGD